MSGNGNGNGNGNGSKLGTWANPVALANALKTLGLTGFKAFLAITVLGTGVLMFKAIDPITEHLLGQVGHFNRTLERIETEVISIKTDFETHTHGD